MAEQKYAKFVSNWISTHRDFHDTMRRKYRSVISLEDFFVGLEESREFTSAWFKYRWNHQELREVQCRGEREWWISNPLLISVVKQFNVQYKEAPKNGTASTSGRARKHRFPQLAKLAVRDLIMDYCKANNLDLKEAIAAFDELISLMPLHRTEVMYELNRLLDKLEPYATTPETKKNLEAAKQAGRTGNKQAITGGRFARHESKEVPEEWKGIITQEEWDYPNRTRDPVSEYLWRYDIAQRHKENTPVYEKLMFNTSPEEYQIEQEALYMDIEDLNHLHFDDEDDTSAANSAYAENNKLGAIAPQYLNPPFVSGRAKSQF